MALTERNMPLSRREEAALVERGVLTERQIGEVRRVCNDVTPPALLSMKNVLLFMGGLIMIGSISIWYTLTKTITGWEIVGLASVLCIAGLTAASYFDRAGQETAAGLMATFAVFAVTLGIYGAQMATDTLSRHASMVGFHHTIAGEWIWMEIGTIVAGLIIVFYYRLPLVTLPIAVALWYMSMDLAPILSEYFITRPKDGNSYQAVMSMWEFRKWVSVVFGLIVIAGAFVIDITTSGRRDFAMWPYAAGVLAFWGGLTAMDGGTELTKAIYAAINVVLIFMGPFLMRRVFIYAGGFGLAMYLGGQALKHMIDRPDFLFTLLAGGGLVMVLGLLWGRYADIIDQNTRWMVPRVLRERWTT